MLSDTPTNSRRREPALHHTAINEWQSNYAPLLHNKTTDGRVNYWTTTTTVRQLLWTHFFKKLLVGFSQNIMVSGLCTQVAAYTFRPRRGSTYILVVTLIPNNLRARQSPTATAQPPPSPPPLLLLNTTNATKKPYLLSSSQLPLQYSRKSASHFHLWPYITNHHHRSYHHYAA